MGVAKKTRKFAEVKRVISRRDNRRQENAGKADAANAQKAKATPNNDIIRVVPQMPSNLFFQVSKSLAPKKIYWFGCMCRMESNTIYHVS
ncbi:hypothetical protein MGN70_002423 [Eutypa lata]|nr:hypothetical protein MGN70_002423 [Eutypa lata]